MRRAGGIGRTAAALTLALTIAAVLGCSASAIAAPGDLDRAFGDDGVVEVTPSPAEAGFQYADAVDMITGPQGEIFVLIKGRQKCSESGPCDDLLVVKYGPDGVRDAGFSGRFESGMRYLTPPRMTRDSDGRIIVAAGGEKGIELMRLGADGTRDPSFGSGGRVSLTASGMSYVADLEKAPDGAIVLLAGVDNGDVPSARDLAIVRIEQNGGLDPRFHGTGVVIYDSGGPDAGGQLAVVGNEIAILLRTVKKLRLVRFGRDGTTLSTSTPRLAGRSNWGFGPLLRNPRGGVWVTGQSSDGTAIASFDARWRKVSNFGTGGSVFISTPEDPLVRADRAARLILAGRITHPSPSMYGSSSGVALTRLLPSGRVDRTFAGGLLVRLPHRLLHFEFENYGKALDVQSDGRIVVLVSASQECVRSCSPSRYFLVRVRGGTSRVSCRGRRATIVGTRRSETIVGTQRGDVIASLDGQDKVFGRGGDDLICGGRTGDFLHGGKGRDHLYGGQGDDSVDGGSGQRRRRP